jgi:hypothetical protein
MFIVWAFFLAFTVFGLFRVLSAVRRGGMTVGGTPVSNVTVVLAAATIVIAWALFAATLLGFIPNHAP